MTIHVEKAACIEVPDGFVVGKYHVELDPLAEIDETYLNDAIVLVRPDDFPTQIHSLDHLPFHIDSVRIFVSYVNSRRNHKEWGEREFSPGSGTVFQGEFSDPEGRLFDTYRFFLLKSKMIEVHIRQGLRFRNPHKFLDSIRQTDQSRSDS